jgi:hypothetical protein
MRQLFLLVVFSLILQADLHPQMSDTTNPDLATPRFLTTQVASTHPDPSYLLNLEKWRSHHAANLVSPGSSAPALHWYRPDLQFRITARWIPSGMAGSLAVPNTLGEVRYESSPGMAEFVLYGQTIRLFPFVEGTNLFFVFRDASNNNSTNNEGRFLYTDLPSHGVGRNGTLILDFNKAENPPCAYSSDTICSLPPQQNRLTIPIPAGEQRYHS